MLNSKWILFLIAVLINSGVSLGIISVSLASSTSSLLSTSNSLPNDRKSDPSPGDGEPGGPLDPRNSSCPKTPDTLTALVPKNDEHHQTIQAHPTVWFYVPYSSETIEFGEFSLLTRDGKQRIYRTKFTLPNTPGIVSITIPEQAAEPLENNQYYRWYIELFCSPAQNSPDIDINGWLQRVARTRETEQSIESGLPDIWYDSLTNLGYRILNTPGDQVIENQWNQLLQQSRYPNISSKPIIGPVQLIE